MKRFIFLILIFAFDVHAKDLILVAERSVPGAGLEQATMVLSNDKVLMTSNSNFLFTESSTTRIGYFEAPMDRLLRAEYNQLKTIANRLLRKPLVKRNQPWSSPYGVSLRINGEVISKDSSFFNVLVRSFENLRISGQWKPIDSVTATFDGKKVQLTHAGTKSRKVASIKPQECESWRKGLKCPVPHYGLVYLTK